MDEPGQVIAPPSQGASLCRSHLRFLAVQLLRIIAAAVLQEWLHLTL